MYSLFFKVKNKEKRKKNIFHSKRSKSILRILGPSKKEFFYFEFSWPLFFEVKGRYLQIEIKNKTY